MPSTTTKRKTVKTLTVSGTSLPIVSASTGAGKKIETDSAAAFGDEMETAVPRLLGSYDDITLECLDEGTAPDVTVGSVSTFTIAITYHDGTATATKSVAKECSVIGIAHGTAQVDGDRKATITITLHPVGGDTLADA